MTKFQKIKEIEKKIPEFDKLTKGNFDGWWLKQANLATKFLTLWKCHIWWQTEIIKM